MGQLTEVLNKQIANWTVLYVKLHNSRVKIKKGAVNHQSLSS